jgi:hypothetical protein
MLRFRCSTCVLAIVLLQASTTAAQDGITTPAAGTMLEPGDQCGGAGGLCNSTSIGVPCGRDAPWQDVQCPSQHECLRINVTLWVCAPSEVGSANPRAGRRNSNATATAGALNAGVPLPPSAAAAAVVPVCGPDQLMANNRMCNSSTGLGGSGYAAIILRAPVASGAAGTSALVGDTLRWPAGPTASAAVVLLMVLAAV